MASKRIIEELSKQDKLRQSVASSAVQRIIRELEESFNRFYGTEANFQGTEAERLIALQRLTQNITSAIENTARTELIKQYKAELKATKDNLALLGFKKVTGYDATTLQTLLEFDVEKVTKLTSTYIDDVKSGLSKLILTGQGFNVQELLDPITGRIESQVTTEIDTLLSGFSRSVQAKQAEKLGLEYFEYAGVEDDITRDFCQELLDKDPPIYSIDEIEAMDNGQGLPVLEYGGGYNCRHKWLPISKEEAKERGYKTDDEDEVDES